MPSEVRDRKDNSQIISGRKPVETDRIYPERRRRQSYKSPRNVRTGSISASPPIFAIPIDDRERDDINIMFVTNRTMHWFQDIHITINKFRSLRASRGFLIAICAVQSL